MNRNIIPILLLTLLLGASPSTSPASRPAPFTITIKAYIDGRCRMTLQGKTAQWQNFDFAAPGRHAGHDEPTTINGADWTPVWDNDDLDRENRVVKSMSDKFGNVSPAIPDSAMKVALEKIKCRDDASIIEQPTKENDFKTVVEFNDDESGGADWYEIKLTFSEG